MEFDHLLSLSEEEGVMPSQVEGKSRLRPSVCATSVGLASILLVALCLVCKFRENDAGDHDDAIEQIAISMTVTCKFQMVIEEFKQDTDEFGAGSYKFGQCTETNGQYYFLTADPVTNTFLPGTTVTIDLVQTTTPAHPYIAGKPLWEVQHVPLYKVVPETARILSTPRLMESSSSSATKTMNVLMVICEYNDLKPRYTSEAILMKELYATVEDSKILDGSAEGSISDMYYRSTYGLLSIPRATGKVVTVQMGSNFADIRDCPEESMIQNATQKVREQHTSVNPNLFTFREFFFPAHSVTGCQEGGVATLGCGHPSLLPNPGECWAKYSIGSDSPDGMPSLRAHELGHNVGLGHSGARESGAWVEYGDPQSLMGGNWDLIGFTAAAREQLGALQVRPGEVIQWPMERTSAITISSLSLPLGQPGADGVAIKFACPKCKPKVPGREENVGGYIWMQFRGDEGYSSIALPQDQQNKVYVHLARHYDNKVYGEGTELWSTLGAQQSFKAEESPYTVFVCSISGDLARVAIGSDAQIASSRCQSTPETTTTTEPAPEPEPEPSAFSKNTDSTCMGSKVDLLRSFLGSEAVCKAKCLQLNCQAFIRVRTGTYAGRCFFRGGRATSVVAFAGRDCFTREMYTKHADKQCTGSLRDLVRFFSGSEESCKSKCADLGCKGFVRVRSGSFAGNCFFRGGGISAPIHMSGRDCFTQVVETVPYTAHAESQCTGSEDDLQRSFVGSEDSCKLKCNELACNGFIRVGGGRFEGQCFFRGGSISKPVAFPGRTCFLLGGADSAVVYTKHVGKQCSGSLDDLLRSFAGSEEACKTKCSELNCVGFIRVRSGRYAGMCFFRGGSITSVIPWTQQGDRDCYVRSA